MPKVYNKHHGDAPADAVFIGRPTIWGNPFSRYGKGSYYSLDRDVNVDRFETLARATPEYMAMIKRELRGKDLVCFCAPKRCHGDVLLKIANEE